MHTKTLLTAGIVAGPIFVTVLAAQTLTRDGFDISRHPISLLSLGAAGWIQIANFVVAGALCCAFAVGLSRVLSTGVGQRWAPRLIWLYGAGLVAGGVFVADPGLGYPAGAPAGIPESLSWHGALHAVAPPFASVALLVATIVLTRRFRSVGLPGWAWYTALSGVVSLLLFAWPEPDSLSWRLALGTAVGFGWLSMLALRERVALEAVDPLEAIAAERSRLSPS